MIALICDIQRNKTGNRQTLDLGLHNWNYQALRIIGMGATGENNGLKIMKDYDKGLYVLGGGD